MAEPKTKRTTASVDDFTLCIMPGFDRYDEFLAHLGKHSCGKSCLYIKRLSDVHVPTLEKIIKAPVQHTLESKRKSAD
jgi:hypothetical protein